MLLITDRWQIHYQPCNAKCSSAGTPVGDNLYQWTDEIIKHDAIPMRLSVCVWECILERVCVCSIILISFLLSLLALAWLKGQESISDLKGDSH